MSDIAELHARAVKATGRLVDGVQADQWHDPTPCADWDVRQLVNHVVVGNLWVAPLVQGRSVEEVGDRLDGDVLGDEPAAAYRRSAEESAAAFLAPDAMTAPVAVSYGPVPGELYAEHRFFDVLVHGWDVAKATGQDTGLDPELVAECWRIVQRDHALFAGSGAFDDALDAPDDAPLQTRLLALLGRHA